MRTALSLAAQFVSTPVVGKFLTGWMLLSPVFDRLFEKATSAGLNHQLDHLVSECHMLPGKGKRLKIRTSPAVLQSTHIGSGKTQAEMAVKIQIIDQAHGVQYFCLYVLDRQSDPYHIVFENYERPRQLSIGDLKFFSVDHIGRQTPYTFEEEGLIKHIYMAVSSLRDRLSQVLSS